MQKRLKFNKKFVIITVCLATLALTAVFFVISQSSVHAASDNMLWGNQETNIQHNSGLGNHDPRIIAARIIQVILGFLGIIAVILILYAGYLWMTSGGDPAKIDTAKKILQNAVIGLVIILMSFAIATFILNRLLEASGSSSGPTDPKGSNVGGLGALGSCTISSVYPEPFQKDVPRNTSLIVTFREEVKANTICNDSNSNNFCDFGESIIPENVRIYITSAGDKCPSCTENVADVSVVSTDNKTFVFTPRTYLGSPTEFIWYTVYLANDILKTNGKGIFDTCTTDYFKWEFQCSNKIDLDPPQVLQGGIFPPEDDIRDIFSGSAAVAASGKITLNVKPNVYQPATMSAVVPGGPSPSATAVVNADNQESGAVNIIMVSDTVAQLQKGATLLGSANLDNNKINFSNYFELTLSSAPTAGNSWTTTLNSMVNADTINIAGNNFIFVTTASSPNQITVGSTRDDAAQNLANKINSGADLVASVVGNVVNLTAKTAGNSGNNIELTTNNITNITIITMSGGVDKVNTYDIKDRKDKPRNAVIQINFNEAVNPLTVSGKASDLYNYIKVVNAEGGLPADSPCSSDSQCQSYTCEGGTGKCLNDYLDGKFLISNQYKTVEFLSNNLCGVNACGEKIYCLPENGHLRVDLVAAKLNPCATNNDCASKSPYNTCAGTLNCYDSTAGKNLPTSIMPPDGLVDMAMNSLDGDRSNEAEGPADFYNENTGTGNGDKYQWSFFLTDEVDLTPPKVNTIDPVDAASNISLSDPIKLEFSKVMMMSSLGTGKIIINNGIEDIEHKLLNLWSKSALAVGYWTDGENIDDSPADGEPDRTAANMKHSMFSDSTTYRSQAGSGVKDIYQNCYSPSTGPSCIGAPSCCQSTPAASESCP